MIQITTLPESAREVLIAINPIAGAGAGGARVQELVELLKGGGYHAEVFTSLEHLKLKLSDAHAGGRLRALVAAGGDGTAAELLNRSEPGVPLALLPLGTENLLSRYLGQGRSPQETYEAIAAGRAIALDAGRANGRLFMLMLSAGFDAEVARRLHSARKGHITRRTWIKPIWQTIRSYEYPELRVYCEEKHQKPEPQPWAGEPERCRWAFGVNLPQYALGLQLAPAAVGSDGQFDLCLLRRGSLFHGLKYLAAVLARQQGRLSDCTFVRSQRFRIEADRPVAYQLDGDPGGWLPVEVEVLPGRMTLLASPQFLQSQVLAASQVRQAGFQP